MKIDIKISTKPIKYIKAIEFLEKRLKSVSKKETNELIWLLEHPSIFTAGRRYQSNEIISNTSIPSDFNSAEAIKSDF